MTPSDADQEKPDFSSLTEIMSRFTKVPYAQFQKELDEWFAEGIVKHGIDYPDLEMSKENNIQLLKKLVASIYEETEQLHENQS